ncbi:RICIN domain-containing protein [Nonomuraea sp. FMUSA5-5]|uniref:RICIN domain-containing protein n=1 Tax=Nonomuraea composti TaxID=2720023 RepID=A0ABX1B2J1_9ACTN|nr:RICIN domain-containing protein [Nonomuraea sp. FMUSA5-5]NJP89406.1 RICIN domain-containing protein [Nonomuraea sp. FMUSA5-5]
MKGSTFLRLALVALLACSATFLGGAASAQPSAAALVSISRIANWNSGKCIVVRGYAERAQATQTTCDSYRDQNWVFTRVGGTGDIYSIRNMNSDKCLVAQGHQPSYVFQNTCANYLDQHWQASPDFGTFRLINRNSFLCMVVQGTALESPVIATDCNATYADQYWRQQQLT